MRGVAPYKRIRYVNPYLNIQMPRQQQLIGQGASIKLRLQYLAFTLLRLQISKNG